MKKLSYTVWQKIAEILSAIVIIATLAALISYWPQIADKIPSHYNSAGQPDAWSNKNMLIALAIVQVVLFIGITVLSLFPKIWNIPVAVSEAGHYCVTAAAPTKMFRLISWRPTIRSVTMESML